MLMKAARVNSWNFAFVNQIEVNFINKFSFVKISVFSIGVHWEFA